MTNFDKLVRWDADFYKSLTEDDRIVCLTERQVYVIGQIINQIKWSGTRWTGDTSGLDFDLIAGNLEYRLAERMTCQNLADILDKITQLEEQINYIFNETAENEGDTVFDTDTTVINDVNTPEELAVFGVSTDGCDTADKDAVYGAVNQLVRYIVQRNVDFLEQINQAGNTPDQIARGISAIPAIGLLPIDEIFSWVNFIATELEDEYNATVDEALIQQVVCDLFCIAVNSGCTLDFNDVYNYFASKTTASFSNAATTFLNLVQFGINGTFSGDDYFYYMSYFQLATIGLGQFYLGQNSLNDYAYQTRSGLNSPDNDWSIFCLSCPTQYRVWTHDFSSGLGDFTIENGTLESGRIRGTAATTPKLATVEMVFDPAWRVIGAKVYNERVDGIANGSHDTRLVALRPTPDSNAGIVNIMVGGFLGNGVRQDCVDGVGSGYWDTGNQLVVQFGVSEANPSTCEIYIDKIEILFDVAHAKPGAVITTDDNLCA